MSVSDLLLSLESERRNTKNTIINSGVPIDSQIPNLKKLGNSGCYRSLHHDGTPGTPRTPISELPEDRIQDSTHQPIPNTWRPERCFECTHRYPIGDNWKCHQRPDVKLYQPRGGVSCSLWEAKHV